MKKYYYATSFALLFACGTSTFAASLINEFESNFEKLEVGTKKIMSTVGTVEENLVNEVFQLIDPSKATLGGDPVYPTANPGSDSAFPSVVTALTPSPALSTFSLSNTSYALVTFPGGS